MFTRASLSGADGEHIKYVGILLGVGLLGSILLFEYIQITAAINHKIGPYVRQNPKTTG